MKSISVALFTVLISLTVSTAVVAAGPGNAVELLTQFRDAVKKKDWKQVRAHIFDLQFEGRSTADEAVATIKKGNKSVSKDFRYHEEAINHIIKNLGSKFVVPDEKTYKAIKKNMKFDKIGGTIAAKKKEDFLFFEVKNAILLMVKDQGAYKLVFWEDLKQALNAKG